MRHETKRFSSLVTALPATFMTAVTTTYIMMAKEGFQMSASVAYPAGILLAIGAFAWYLTYAMKTKSVGAPPPMTAAA